MQNVLAECRIAAAKAIVVAAIFGEGASAKAAIPHQCSSSLLPRSGQACCTGNGRRDAACRLSRNARPMRRTVQSGLALVISVNFDGLELWRN